MTLPCPHPRPKLDQPGYAPARLAWQPPALIPTGSPADMARAIREALAGIFGELMRLSQRRNLVPLIEDMDAREGQVIFGVAAGQTVRLPEPAPGGLGVVTVLISDVITPVTLVQPDGTVLTLDQPGTYDVSIGPDETAWQPPPGVSSSGSAGGAGVLLDAAHASFPNGRVATDSVEIDAELAVPGVITWALRVASVVFAKLQDLTGLSVLGRAANTSGVMAAITATGARQALMSDAAGTAIAWRAITAADVPAHTWAEVLAAGATSGASNPIVDVGQFMQLGAVGPTTSSPQIRSGDATFRIRGGGNTFVFADGASGFAALVATDTTGQAIVQAQGASGHAELNSAGTATVEAATSVTISADGGTTGMLASSAGVNLSTGGFTRLVIEPDGSWQINSSNGTDGQYLRSFGAAATPQWASLDVTNTELAQMAANTIKANPTGALADAQDLAITAESVVGRTSGNIANITSSLQSILMRSSGSVFWGTAGADQTLRRSGSGDLGFGTLVTNNIGDDQVTLAKLANVTADSFIGKITAGTGDPVNVPLADVDSASIIFDATSHTFQRAALTGDVTASQNSNATTIANDAVTNAKLANMAANTIKANPLGGSADPQDLVISSDSFPASLGGSLVSHPFATLAGNGLDYASGVLSVDPENRMHAVLHDTGLEFRVGFRKSRTRHFVFEEFDLAPSATVTTTAGIVNMGETNWFAQAVSASGSIAPTTGTDDHPGICRLTTGAGDNNGIQLFRGGNTLGFASMLASDIYSMECVVRLSTVTSTSFEFGWKDSADNNFIEFYRDTDVGTTIHSYVEEGGAATDTDTGSTSMTADAWVVLTMLQETAGTIDFYVDDVLEDTRSTNVPDTETGSMFFRCFTRTTAARTFDIDYVSFESRDFTSNRTT